MTASSWPSRSRLAPVSDERVKLWRGGRRIIYNSRQMANWRSLIGLVLGPAVACATGVDVTDGELAAICSEPGTTCGGTASAAGTSGTVGTSTGGVGIVSSGGSSSGISGGSSGGNSGAVSTSGGQAGSSSSSGSAGSGAGTIGPSTPIEPIGGCVAPAPSAVGGCATDSEIAVLYTDRSDAVAFNQVTMTLDVENTGADFPLTDLVVRYWFAADGQTEFVSEIDYAQIGKENVCVSFGNQLGQAFADIGFSSSASIGTGVLDVQVRLHTPNYAQQDQSNDFSFIAGAQGAPNENITVYRAGTRVAGCEPE